MRCDDFAKEANDKFGPRLKVITPSSGQAEYDASCVISNSRLVSAPCAIAYCLNEDHVVFCVQYCAAHNRPLRIRSGGHHHEGMCSANDALVIDLSGMNAPVDLTPGYNMAWIQPGKKLGDGTKDGLYHELALKNLVLPGGGCQSVNIGGLVLGGGWGASARMYGLTCDSLLEARVVLANGQIVSARQDNKYEDLFMAIRGGGGGNFGVVVKYLFQLYPLTERWLFTIAWPKSKMKEVAEVWRKMFSGQYAGLPANLYTSATSKELIPNITAGLRLNVVDDEIKEAAVLDGAFYGAEADVRAILKPFLDIAHLRDNIRKPAPPILRGDGESPILAMDGHIQLGLSMQPGMSYPAPTQTCDAPHPHKVTSCFPIDIGDKDYLTTKITDYILSSTYSAQVNKYINLMSMGGKIKNVPATSTAFPYRNKDFMLQMQAWWTDVADLSYGDYIMWIENFRKSLVPMVEGAFINFPDKMIDPILDIKTISGRAQLLNYYYSTNLPTLRVVKSKYDPSDVFSFEMGVPPHKNPKLFSSVILKNSGKPVQAIFKTNEAGQLTYCNQYLNGAWQAKQSLPVQNISSFSETLQVSTFLSMYSNPSQNIYVLDTKGKLWQYFWNYNGTPSPIVSLDSAFKSSPHGLAYELTSITATTIPGNTNATLIFMTTASGQLWSLAYEDDVNYEGAVNYPTALSNHFVYVSCASSPRYVSLCAVDDKGKLWYAMIDSDSYTWPELTNVMGDSMPITGVKSVSNASDSNANDHIIVIDTTKNDLWYVAHQKDGQWPNNFQNIQDAIAKVTPSFERVQAFAKVSANFDVSSNTLHVYASDRESVIYHTTRNAQGQWSVFDVVPD